MFAHAAGSRTAPAHTSFPPSSPSAPDRVELYAAPQDLHTNTHTHTHAHTHTHTHIHTYTHAHTHTHTRAHTRTHQIHTNTHTIPTQHYSPRRTAFASPHKRPYTNAYAHCLRHKTLTHTDPAHMLIPTHRRPFTHYPQGTHVVAKAVAGRPPQFMVHRPTLVLESSTPT
eukprot:GHVU01194886.1.p3 GENE.GHVU01194886.1~~GHVU01194886.1.p3  ORF type:complete len:170 (-),score=0.70 GHVU01194886.1:161-670(-)